MCWTKRSTEIFIFISVTEFEFVSFQHKRLKALTTHFCSHKISSIFIHQHSMKLSLLPFYIFFLSVYICTRYRDCDNLLGDNSFIIY